MVPHICPYFDEESQSCDLRQPEYLAARNRHYLIMGMQFIVIFELVILMAVPYVR